MQVVDPELEGRGLALLLGCGVHLGSDPLDDLFDTRGVNTSICNQLLDSLLGHGPTIGVETRQDDGLWCVVDNELDLRRHLECSDVAAFAPDDPALEIVAREVDDRHGGFDRVFRGAALNGLRDDVFGFGRCSLARLVLEFLDEIGCISTSVGLQLAKKNLLGLIGRHARHSLELPLLLGGELCVTVLLRLGLGCSLGDRGFPRANVRFRPLERRELSRQGMGLFGDLSLDGRNLFLAGSGLF